MQFSSSFPTDESETPAERAEFARSSEAPATLAEAEEITAAARQWIRFNSTIVFIAQANVDGCTARLLLG